MWYCGRSGASATMKWTKNATKYVAAVTASACHCTLTPEGTLPAYHEIYMVAIIVIVKKTSNISLSLSGGLLSPGYSEESFYKYNTYA